MSALENLHSKIIDRSGLAERVKNWKANNRKIVFTNGCFDILHPGHVEYLAKAADLGDVLVVGLNSDISVRALDKGPNRPIQDQKARAIILASLASTSAIVIFEEPTPYELIDLVQPDVLVKGGDWKPDQIVGSDIVLKRGGVVKSIEFLEGHSTTSIEQKILKGKMNG